MPAKKTRPLGQGLAALIKADSSNTSSAYKENFEIKNIEPNPMQPRMRINPEDLIDLANSIREKGIIQPLIITKGDEPEKYYLIAGERRLKAAKLAGLKRVPVVIKDSSPQDMLEIALIENIQREDLNILEEAQAFKQLQDDFNLTHDEIGIKLGLSRVAVTNKIRLLKVPIGVRESILLGEISEGHARALLGLKDDESISAASSLIIKRNLTVRETEQLVRRINYSKGDNRAITKDITRELSKLEKRIQVQIGFRTQITKHKSGGKVTIRFKDDAELRELSERLTRLS